ncbi:MAG: CAP domain-containing protein [Acidobacteriaceae bacterium]
MKLKHYLIASEQNGYRPWIMSSQAVAVYCLAIWGLRMFLPVSFTVAAPAIDANEIMSKVNLERTNRFLPALVVNSKLNAAATIKSEDMLKRSYFAHVNPDGNYVWGVIQAQGYTPFLTLGENLAMDFTDADSMVKAWMNSPAHRNNILNNAYQDQGAAAIYGLFEAPTRYSILATNLFGTLEKPKATTPTTPTAPAPPAKTTPPKTSPVTQPIASANSQPSAPEQPAPTETAQEPKSLAPISIGNDLRVVLQAAADRTVLRFEATITGTINNVAGKYDDQTIQLTKTGDNLYSGELILPKNQSRLNGSLSIIAYAPDGKAETKDFDVNKMITGVTAFSHTPLQSESDLSNTLKIIFAVFAGCFLIFAIIDSIIIFRQGIKRKGPLSSPQALIFLIVGIVNLVSVLYF